MNPSWMPGVAALMGLALAGPVATAAADPRDPYDRGHAHERYERSRDYRYQSYAARRAWEKGYEDGLNRGRHDGEHGDRFDLTRDRRFREGDHGYKSSYGPRYEYVRAYRAAYEQGYREGFDPYYARGHYGRDRYRGDRYYR